MKKLLLLLLSSIWLVSATQTQESIDLEKMVHQPGFIDFYWDSIQGKIYLQINKLDEEILYNTGLAAGVGSNDLGLDRGQLGGSHVVLFNKVGDKILLVEKNLDYRAVSEDPLERRAVEEAFAHSVLWGFKSLQRHQDGYLVDATKFLLRDVHQVSQRLADQKQGTYKVDETRSAIYLPRTKNFPQNTELEATITLTGIPKGSLIRSVTPSPQAVTVRQHHSFIQLPDDQYKPRKFDPRCGYSPLSFYDYATPIDAPLVQRFIRRHRLQKKDPSAAISEPIEPIIYYMDPGAPEPIKSALIEGAAWWNQAFEAAGYHNAFRMEVLPADADPMDVRYNVIQWVHRSTRGWSYGSSVTDPRTGEIIKGHVSLGSLRVRQDYLIAQGLIQAFDQTPDKQPLVDLALARLRQLAAHEVGHTLGLAHNFAASTNDRASVMDYPHPLVQISGGSIDFANAYDSGIGAWDKRTIIYGYQDFLPGVEEQDALLEILEENNRMGLRYISDQDARPMAGAHPYGHLWDNGSSIVEELQRIIEVRKVALQNFGLENIPAHTPTAELENVLVPLFLSHRYQSEAVSKLIGGVIYHYAVKGEAEVETQIVDPQVQEAAFEALLATLKPEFLTLPESIISLIPPRPIGYQRDRELFKIRTGITFDPIAAAEASAAFTLKFLLNPQRLSRVIEQSARNSDHRTITQWLQRLESVIGQDDNQSGLEGTIVQVVHHLYIKQLIKLAGDETAHHQVRGAALLQLDQVIQTPPETNPHNRELVQMVQDFLKHPREYESGPMLDMPDGSPIGCGYQF